MFFESFFIFSLLLIFFFKGEALASRQLGQHFFQKAEAQKNPLKKPPKGIKQAYQELQRRRSLRERKSGPNRIFFTNEDESLY